MRARDMDARSGSAALGAVPHAGAGQHPIVGPASGAGQRRDPATERARTLGRSFRSGAADMAAGIGRWRIPELVLFACLIFEGGLFGLPLPFNQITMAAIIVLALTRRPHVSMGRLQLIAPVLILGLFYITMISMFADPSELAFDWRRRLIRLALTTVFILAMAAGRIELRSALAGLGVGLVGNAVAFYAGLAPDGYAGVLSGFLMDKNVAGLTYAVVGLLLLIVIERVPMRIVMVLGMGSLVWLTGSRTAISAYVAGVLWVLLAPRIGALGRWLFGVAIIVGVDILAEDYSRIGIFSNRAGSDLLRHRIDEASRVKVDEAGFFGSGLGEAYVVFPDNPTKTWFFHNSFWSALVEGGWPWLLLLLGITVVVALRPLATTIDYPELVAQAAAIATLICAWKLGEVLFTLQWGLLLGIALLVRAEAGALRLAGSVNDRREADG